jgi:hypothetical protein
MIISNEIKMNKYNIFIFSKLKKNNEVGINIAYIVLKYKIYRFS